MILITAGSLIRFTSIDYIQLNKARLVATLAKYLNNRYNLAVF